MHRNQSRPTRSRWNGTIQNRLRQRFRPSLDGLEPRQLLATFTVSNVADSGAGSLRDAIALANTTAGSDTIDFDATFNAAQTITLTSGQLALTDTEATTIAGPGAHLLSISGNDASRVFQLSGGAVATLSGLTITQGSAYPTAEYPYDSAGGGINNAGGTLTLANCIISGNTSAGNGPGLYNTAGGSAELTDCTIHGNSGFQGALFNNGGTLSLTGCTISGNTAVFGGGLYTNSGGLTSLRSCTVSGNAATASAGGVYSSRSITSLTDCIIEGNTARHNGGGMFAVADNQLFVDGCTFTKNHAGQMGGAISNNEASDLTVTNSTFTGNSAGYTGGAVFSGGSNENGGCVLVVTNCTVTENSAGEQGGGFYDYPTNGDDRTFLNNTILAGNTGPGGVPADVFGMDLTGAHNNLIGSGGAGGLLHGVDGNIIGVDNPGLDPLGGYGGPTPTMRLRPGSPAIDAGDNSLAVDANGSPLTTDQQRRGRIDPNTNRVDIGAFESQALPAIVSLAVAPVNRSVALGSVQPFVAVGTFQDGTIGNISALVTWGSSNPTVAMINPSGQASTQSLGTTEISASFAGLPTAVATLSVAPPTGLLTIAIAMPGFQFTELTPRQATAVGNYSNGAVDITNSVTWNSSDPSVASVSSDGLVTPLRAGYSNLTASLEGVTSFGIELNVTFVIVNTTADENDTANETTSLREAIEYANNNPGPDSILFDPALFDVSSTITLSLGELNLFDTSGPTTIEGPTAGVTVSGGGLGRVFVISEGTTVSLVGLTITGGSSDLGGGVLNHGALTLADSILLGNRASDGGSIYNIGSLVLDGVVIHDSRATRFGGGINNQGSMTLIRSTVSGNTGLYGGGIYSVGPATLTDSSISGNRAPRGIGGGIYSRNTSLVMTGCTISGNSAGSIGGVSSFGRDPGVSVEMTNCTVTGNSAVVYDSVQGGNVGGLFLYGPANTLTNCTISGNSDKPIFFPSAGGIEISSYYTPAVVTLINSIVAGNGTDIRGNGKAVGWNNLIGTGGSGGLINGVDGNIVGVANPRLGPLGFYGGPTQTMPLLPGSPAIDAALEGLASEFDQRGLGRFGAPDIGAFESQGFVSTLVGWGSVGSATLDTDADRLRLLPEGRSLTLPWAGLHTLSITLDGVAGLSAGDFSVKGINVADYGPVTVEAAGTTYKITLARPIAAADRVTIRIGVSATAAFTRRLDVLPGDVNDDGITDGRDMVLVRNAFTGLGQPVQIDFVFLDVNGDGVVDVNDYNVVRKHLGKKLPKLPS